MSRTSCTMEETQHSCGRYVAPTLMKRCFTRHDRSLRNLQMCQDSRGKKRSRKQKWNHLRSKFVKSLTYTVHNHQTRDHQDGVPVELQGRAVPGEPASPLAAPHAHTNHAGQTEAEAQQVGRVEHHEGPHPGGICRLKRSAVSGQTVRHGADSVDH